MSKKRIKAVLVKAGGDGVEPLRYEWHLPATADAYEQMVEQGAMAAARNEGWKVSYLRQNPAVLHSFRHEVRVILAAWGITRPKK